MKPFSKMEAIGNGKPVVTRNGRKVLQIFEVTANIGQPVVAMVEGDSDIQTFTSDGKFYESSLVSVYDLFMATTTKEGWVAFGTERLQEMHGLVGFATHVWPTEEVARASYRGANEQREPKGVQKVSWEE